jgi:hypothetical protein
MSCRVRITASDHSKGKAKGKLIAYLYGDKLKSSWSDLVGDDHTIQFLAKITGITPDKAITLDRALPYDLRTEWRAVSVHDWSPAAEVSARSLVWLWCLAARANCSKC